MLHSRVTFHERQCQSSLSYIGRELLRCSVSSTALSTPTSFPPAKSGGLTTGTKAGIGIGAAAIVLFLTSGICLAFWWGKQSALKKRDNGQTLFGKAESSAEEIANLRLELEDGESLRGEERRKASDLEGGVGIHPVELDDWVVGERVELETRRKNPRELVEVR